mgnify:CR=1 FL=1
MPPTVKDFAVAIARQVKVKAIREGTREYAAALAQIRAEDVLTLIQAGKPLRDILPRRVAAHPLARRVLEEDPDVLLEVLEEYNPKLARILSTPAGREWWSMNRGRGT